MNTSQRGNIGEIRALLEFSRLGIQCYTPLGDGQTVDIVADFNGKLNRIQVKTCSKLNKSGAMEWKLTKQAGYHGTRQSYNKTEVDYFALYCIENDAICLIPFSECLPSATLSIRPDDYEGAMISSMRFQKDYLFSKFVITSI
tara:strand:- start:1263 stop:1691 length:429 start_codon:yes stop_codon:yes gene_type:complete